MTIKRVGIDMGHSLTGAGAGAVGVKKETDMNRLVGKRLVAMLQEKGVSVVNCTVDSASTVDAQLAGIVKKANAQHLDLFVSLHLNCFKNETANGVETYVYTGCDKTIAKRINDELAIKIKWYNRGVKEANYYVLRNTSAPAILIELGFCSNKGDMDKLIVENVARVIFKGIMGIDYSGEVATPPLTATSSDFIIGDYGKNVKADSDLNVRSGRGTEHKIIGTLKKGAIVTVNYILPDNRDGKGDDALWGSINFEGQTGYIHLGYVTPTTGIVTTQPVISCDKETKRYTEKGKCTITASSIRFRNKPCTCHGEIEGTYDRNESVYYDLVVITNNYVWISWIGTTGARRYMPIKDKKSNERWGICI
ncbi:MAG: SH3 domain-containing protein [Clostridium sp.]|uniref:N-acetylmuramoyl-L-alanine amidase n=1 Tax=Clostridium sp. TaxID=1506 RepID=UPI0025B9E526|nr:N-acetylmuramoyl-L-alanine amidase [Clostridium sp.]MCI9304028.1 SH3 domain-containing protein [Clostridium sp.]